MKNFFNIIASGIITFASYFLGGWDLAIQVLLIVLVIDYISGVLKAIKNKELNSATGLWGIIKKCGYLLVVALSVVVDKITGTDGVIRNLVIYFFVANDGISILENLGAIGVPLPQKLIDVLQQLKNDNM